MTQPLVAAIYARKSTEQTGVPGEERSVARQVEHARGYAARKGWAVADECVFVDDGASGAEFGERRPGYLRLMAAVTRRPRPPFDVLVMSEESRLGRESIETAYAHKQLNTNGVRVFGYLEDRELTLDNPLDKLLLSVTAFADEVERDKARQRTHDAMTRKARAGQATGGRVFGYDIVRLEGAVVSERPPALLRVNDAEAAVVREIFERFGMGEGTSSIAKDLNERGAPSPRAQQGRPRGWAPSSVREVLTRERYRGVNIWNRTRKRDRWGRKAQRPRPESEWLRVEVPELRIVTDEQWEAVAHRFALTKRSYSERNPRGAGRPAGSGVKYLLASLLRCSTCGSTLEVRTRKSGAKRVAFYGCGGHHRRGRSVCSNALVVPAAAMHEAVLSRLRSVVLDPDAVETTLREAEARWEELRRQGAQARSVDTLRARRTTLEAELKRLADAIANGADVDAVRDALQERQACLAEVERALVALDRVKPLPPLDITIRERLSERLAEWQRILENHPAEGNALLRRILAGSITFTAREDERGQYYEFVGQATFGAVLAGFVAGNTSSPAPSPIPWAVAPQRLAHPPGTHRGAGCPHNLASPTGFEPVFQP